MKDAFHYKQEAYDICGIDAGTRVGKSITSNNMITWARNELGNGKYAGWCLSFIEDAFEISNNMEIFGDDCVKESYEMYKDSARKGIPERGSFVFYDCICMSEQSPVNWGHCGIG